MGKVVYWIATSVGASGGSELRGVAGSGDSIDGDLVICAALVLITNVIDDLVSGMQ